jgi:molybdate transport system ATP-binding protein
LLDEPFSAVDRATRESLYQEITSLRAHLAMPVVLVTHDMAEAQLLADHMVLIDKGQVLRQGPTAEVMSDAVALRAMGIRDVASILRASVVAHDPDGLTRLITAAGPLLLPQVDAAPGAQVRVRILAHEVILSRGRPEGLSAQNILAGQITRITQGQGPAMMVHIAIGGDEIIARITRRAADQMALRAGETVHAIIKAMSVGRDQIAR